MQYLTGFALSRVQTKVTEQDLRWCVQHTLPSFAWINEETREIVKSLLIIMI